MVRLNHERILLIGDPHRQTYAALTSAIPAAHVTAVATLFDAIAELTASTYTAVLASAEPIERRPEAAVRTLRQLAGDARLLLFGHPTLEPLSRKMLDFGADDYLVTPASPSELQQIFGTPPLRLTPSSESETSEPVVTSPPTRLDLLSSLPLAEILMEAMLQHPHNASADAIRLMNQRIAPTMQLHYIPVDKQLPPIPDGFQILSHSIRMNNQETATLHLLMPRDDEPTAARHFLSQLAHLLSKAASLQDRHNRLQKLAITDDLTGVHNGRYFNHFLNRILEKAKVMRFPVTLLLFDIDDFKKYNSLYGHGVGDEILKQTAALMRQCCRDHDMVARLSGGGDEFAVVFWEKEGPRTPREPKPPGVPTSTRVPQNVVQIFERFRRLLLTQHFHGLGPTGQGTLTISGGLAVFPYDATDAAGLIAAADNAMMFGAKQSGKNQIFLVGSSEHYAPHTPNTNQGT